MSAGSTVLTVAGGPVLRYVTHMVGKLQGASVPYHVDLSIEYLITRQLASSEQVREQNQRMKEVSFLQLNLGRDIPSLLLYSIS